MTFVWRAVRCCCQPTKLLGFLRLPDRHAVLYKITDRAGVRHTVEVRSIGESTIELDFMNSAATRTTIERELAVYSEDRGVDFWRTIPAFVEVKDDAP
jgi:hypothetical protein